MSWLANSLGRGEQLTDKLTVAAVINQLRRILGTEELIRLRAELVTRALQNIENSAKNDLR